MASCLDELQIKYQGQTFEVSKDSTSTTIVYQGSKELCLEAQRTDLAGGMVNPDYGTITHSVVTQQDGPFWQIEVTYETAASEFSHEAGQNADGTDKDLNHSQLSVRVIQNDIQMHPMYLRWWDNCVWWTSRTQTSVPGASIVMPIILRADATYPVDYVYKSGDYYITFSMNTPQPLVFSNQSYSWNLLQGCYKPGVTSYDIPTYEMQEFGRFNSKSDAQKFVSKRIATITTPKKGDFGVVKAIGGNWLCEGAEINNDGKNWIASLTYMHSVSSDGWDPEIYGDPDDKRGTDGWNYSQSQRAWIQNMHRRAEAKKYKQFMQDVLYYGTPGYDPETGNVNTPSSDQSNGETN